MLFVQRHHQIACARWQCAGRRQFLIVLAPTYLYPLIVVLALICRLAFVETRINVLSTFGYERHTVGPANMAILYIHNLAEWMLYGAAIFHELFISLLGTAAD